MSSRYDDHDMFMLQQYLAKRLDSLSSCKSSSKLFPFAVDQMAREDVIINHDVADNAEMLKQTLDSIVVDSLRRVAAITIQKAWTFYKKRGMSSTNLQI